MDIQERLTLESASAHTTEAMEHRHRYELAARLLEGDRILDLCSGVGYGTRILVEGGAKSATGVDRDAAAIDAATAAHSINEAVAFETADALQYLARARVARDFDSIVCFEGLEHLDRLEEVVGTLRALAHNGMRLVVTVPNSRTLGEDNPFHVTNFDLEFARNVFSGFPETAFLFQHLTEGSLIRSNPAQIFDSRMVLEDRGEIEYANHFIVCVNLAADAVQSTRTILVAAPMHNRYLRNLELANAELWHTNAQLARTRLGAFDAAAALQTSRIEEAESRLQEIEDLHRTVGRLRHELENVEGKFNAPRYRFVDGCRNAIRGVPLLGRVIEAAWRVARALRGS